MTIFPRAAENLAEVRNKITFIKGSITDIEVVRKAMHEADYVLHLAARTSVPRSVKDPIGTNTINIDGTLNVWSLRVTPR